MSDTNTIVAMPGLSSMLTVLFVALKLTGVVAWSWWWVLAPLWVPILLLIAIAIIILGGVCIYCGMSSLFRGD